MISKYEIDIFVDMHRIVNIQNIFRENNDFLTIFLDERKILKTHIDNKRKKIDVISKKQFLQTHINNNISKSFKNNKKTLFEIFIKTIFFSKETISSTSQMSKKITINDYKISFSLHKNLVSKNRFDFFNKFNTIDFVLIKQMFSLFEFKRILNLK